jgi:predicted TIM-barrel fold metal-dependent hydrolase
MRYDIHVHVPVLDDPEGRNHLCPPRRRSLLLHHLVRRARRIRREAGGREDAVRARLDAWMRESRVDRFVLLAIDAAHADDGSPDLANTRASIHNDYVAEWAAAHPKALFGASVHPLRKDALDELDRVAARGACLVKWLPSAQNIAPDDERCIPFYERLAALGLPLLSHAGVEHTLPAFDDDLNAPRRLRLALRRGVTVIAAHCGAPLFLHERSAFGEWRRMALEHPRFFGDVSGFALPVHGGPRRAILRDPDLAAKIVFGSDFPAQAFPLWCLSPWRTWTGPGLRRVRNPFDRAAATLAALGVPEAAFTRAGSLLRLPAHAGPRRPGAGDHADC